MSGTLRRLPSATPLAALPRRGVLRGGAALLAALAGGCGFRPIHGRDAGDPASGDALVAGELSATRVPVIPDRFGQLLRRGLQERLSAGAGSAGPAARWDLVVSPSIAAEAIGIQRDGAATRVRYIATANWSLVRLTPREAIANGFERAIEAFNIQPNQFFAADMSREAMERRLADQLAQDVVLRVALRFRGLQEGAATRLIEPVETPRSAPDMPVGPVRGGPAVPLPRIGTDGGPAGGLGSPGMAR